MAPSRALNRLLRPICPSCAHQKSTRRSISTTLRRLHNDSEPSHLPRITQPSLWSSLIPKAFRAPSDPVSVAERAKLKASKSKEWNPSTIFIMLGLVVGSNAIQIIGIRREMLNFSRQTDARLELLRETVKKVKNGEPVDVRRVLGTGDPAQEAEWEQVVKELEDTDLLWEGKLRRDKAKAERLAKEEEGASRRKDREMEARESESRDSERGQDEGSAKPSRPRFLM